MLKSALRPKFYSTSA